MPTQNRPDLHDEALALIAKVHGIHQAGSGKLSLEALAIAFGADLSPEDLAALRQRGDISFTKVDAAGGTFQNSGDEIKRQQGNIKVTVPPLIEGTYTASALTFVLKFDQDHTIRGSTKILGFTVTVKVKSVLVDQKKIFVDSTIDQADLTINHG